MPFSANSTSFGKGKLSILSLIPKLGTRLLYRLDAKVTALDAKSGKEMWTQTVVDYTQGSVITSPPVVAKNVIITGFGGGG